MKRLLLVGLLVSCGTEDKPKDRPEVWKDSEAVEEGFGLIFPVPVPVEPPPVVVETDCEDDAYEIWDSWHDGKHLRHSHGGPGLQICWPGEKNNGKKSSGRFCIGDNNHKRDHK